MNISHADMENKTSELLMPLLQGQLADWASDLNAHMEARGMTADDVRALEEYHASLVNLEMPLEGQIEKLTEKLGSPKAAIEFWGVFGLRDSVHALLLGALDTAQRQLSATSDIEKAKPAPQEQGWLSKLLHGGAKKTDPAPTDQGEYFKRRAAMNNIYTNIRGMMTDFSGLGSHQIDQHIERLKTGIDQFVAEQLGRGH